MSRIFWFLLLVFLQVVVFNHVHILGYATPLPYIYALLILPSNTPRWLYLVAGFLLGLSIDTCTNTPGMAAAATTATDIVSEMRLFIVLCYKVIKGSVKAFKERG